MKIITITRRIHDMSHEQKSRIPTARKKRSFLPNTPEASLFEMLFSVKKINFLECELTYLENWRDKRTCISRKRVLILAPSWRRLRAFCYCSENYFWPHELFLPSCLLSATFSSTSSKSLSFQLHLMIMMMRLPSLAHTMKNQIFSIDKHLQQLSPEKILSRQQFSWIFCAVSLAQFCYFPIIGISSNFLCF